MAENPGTFKGAVKQYFGDPWAVALMENFLRLEE